MLPRLSARDPARVRNGRLYAHFGVAALVAMLAGIFAALHAQGPDSESLASPETVPVDTSRIGTGAPPKSESPNKAIPPTITKQPDDVTTTAFTDANFTVNFIGVPTPTVAWQFSPDGAYWSDIPGATSGLLTVRNPVMSHNGLKWRARVAADDLVVYSRAATLTVVKARATIKLDSLVQRYDGSAKNAAIETVPGRLKYSTVYRQNGIMVPKPTAAGRYDVKVEIDDRNYEGTANGTLVIEP